MEKLFKDFLIELKFDEGEIKDLVSLCPMLEDLELSDALVNLNLVVEYGYPADEISYLISVNPSFLCRNSQDLRDDLISLANSITDIEEALKNDPFLI